MTGAAWWEQFFDEDYLRLWASVPRSGDEEASALWRILGLIPGSRVLDAGCGYGRVSLPLALKGARVLGVDQAAPLLAEAERRRGDLVPEQLRYLLVDCAARHAALLPEDPAEVGALAERAQRLQPARQPRFVGGDARQHRQRDLEVARA